MNVFDYAMSIERSGRKFYRSVADRTAVPGVRTIFNMMASDEEELLERFRSMKAAQSMTLADSRALERAGNIFADKLNEREALQIDNDLDAYHYVMRIEREICRIYEEAFEREANPEVKGLLRRIASEERRELESLRKLYEFVNAPNEYLAWGEFSNLGEFHNFGRDEG